MAGLMSIAESRGRWIWEGIVRGFWPGLLRRGTSLPGTSSPGDSSRGLARGRLLAFGPADSGGVSAAGAADLPAESGALPLSSSLLMSTSPAPPDSGGHRAWFWINTSPRAYARLRHRRIQADIAMVLVRTSPRPPTRLRRRRILAAFRRSARRIRRQSQARRHCRRHRHRHCSCPHRPRRRLARLLPPPH